MSVSGVPSDDNANVILEKLVLGSNLEETESKAIIKKIMVGELNSALTAAILVALKIKGESVNEIAGAAKVMRSLVKTVECSHAFQDDIVDLCGTGGDGLKTFNISTGAMFVVSGAGGKVAKHGGRAVSSSTGSADLLEGLGANINLTPPQVLKSIEKTGIGFMFAPNYHPAMKNVAPIRKSLGTRTIFNLLGPLTNPAGAKRQLVGVYSKDLLKPIAEVLRELGSTHVLAVCGENGLDELNVFGKTYYAELKNGKITTGFFSPSDCGLSVEDKVDYIDFLEVSDVEGSKRKVLRGLEDSRSVEGKFIALNAGAALYVAGKSNSISEGFHRAEETIKNGKAIQALEKYIVTTTAIGSN